MGAPYIDLFVPRNSTIAPQYMSEDVIEQYSEFTNALRPYNLARIAWIFNPPILIPRLLSHINWSRGTHMLVAPKWNKAF